MRLISFLFFGLLSIGQADEVVLSKFDNQTLQFPYGSWVDKATDTKALVPGPKGLSVAGGATAKGGACVRNVQLKFSDAQVIELQVTVLKGNKAKVLNVLLENEGAKQAGWRFDLSGIPIGETRTLVSSPISKPAFTNPEGASFDPSAVISWHVQGDFSGDAALRVRLNNLVVKSQEKVTIEPKDQ
jgi:hypothetical protein